MGATTSKNEQTIITKKNLAISQNEYNDIKESCSVKQSAKNIIKLQDIKGSDLTIHQKNAVQNMCILKAALESRKEGQLLNKTMAALDSTQKTEGGIFNAESDNMQRIDTNLKTKLSQDIYNRVRRDCFVKQKAVDNIIKGKRISNSTLALNQANSAYNSCLFKYASKHDLSAGLEDDSSASAVSTQKTIGGGLFGFGSFFFLILIGVAGYVYMQSEDSEEDYTGSYIAIGLLFILAIALISIGLYFWFEGYDIEINTKQFYDENYKVDWNAKDKHQAAKDLGLLKETFAHTATGPLQSLETLRGMQKKNCQRFDKNNGLIDNGS